MLVDVRGRRTVAAEHVEQLRRDFLAPRRQLRAAVGRGLVRVGVWLAGEPEPKRSSRTRARLRPAGQD